MPTLMKESWGYELSDRTVTYTRAVGDPFEFTGILGNTKRQQRLVQVNVYHDKDSKRYVASFIRGVKEFHDGYAIISTHHSILGREDLQQPIKNHVIEYTARFSKKRIDELAHEVLKCADDKWEDFEAWANALSAD